MSKDIPPGFYQNLVETSQDLIWQCDTEGRFIYLNPVWEEIFGYKLSEMLGRPFSEFQQPDIAKRDSIELDRLLQSGIVRGYETSCISKAGQDIHLVINAKYIYDDKKAVAGVQGTAYDVTLRKQKDLKLAESVENFRMLFDRSPVGKAIVGLDKRFIRCNEAFCKFIGYAENEIIGKTIADITFPEDINIGMLEMQQLSNGKLEVSTVQKRYLRKDGSIVWGEIKISLVRNRQNEPMYFLPVIQDITAKKKFQEKLSASERRFRELVRNSSDSVTILDKNGMQIYVSDVVEKMLGYKPEELMNIPVMEKMIHPDDRKKVEDAFQKIITDGSVKVQYRHRHKNGSWVLLEGWGTNQLENEDIRGIVVNVRDITEQVMAAEEREKLNHQINQIQKLESIGLLAGGIAHDFNNILAMIFGYIDMGIRKSSEESVKEALTKSLTAMNRARALTGQLLTFAKGGAPVLKIAPLFPFVKETIQFALSGSNVAPTFNVAPDLLFANYDQNQIGQAIDNIVINAQQAMPMGGVIEITANNVFLADKEHSILPKGRYTRISIKDQGIGIPKDLLNKIFDPFFTTKTKGHGLGLATCFSIISRHGGCIDVESVLENGSTFHVYLPAEERVALTPEQAKLDLPSKTNGTFLIMDDEVLILEVTKDMLESLGFSVVCCEDGKSAISFIAEELKANRKILGAMLDLTIPGGMGGKEAIAEIRKLSSDVPVYVSSGYAEDPVMAKPKEHGFTASLCKPFKLAELAEMLSRQ
ncbi:MAG: PAS domain S-box protein [Fibrobacteres bacterium]|nr:PAS domain S-box protein [Fibrobacterota bacterium]